MAFVMTDAGARAVPHAPAQLAGPVKHNFEPYDWNGGTIVCITGADFCVLACDTRLATGYSIHSRFVDRTFQLSPTTLVATGGCHADVTAFYNSLKYRATMYRFDHEKHMSTEAAAQLVSNTLYYKRFFPYYCVPVLCGLDSNGRGYCTNYDVVGSYVRSVDCYTANGSSASIVMPVLDNLFGTLGVSSGQTEMRDGKRRKKDFHVTLDQAAEIMKQVFIAVGERDIMCGDAVIISKITKDGIARETFELKKD